MATELAAAARPRLLPGGGARDGGPAAAAGGAAVPGDDVRFVFPRRRSPRGGRLAGGPAPFLFPGQLRRARETTAAEAKRKGEEEGKTEEERKDATSPRKESFDDGGGGALTRTAAQAAADRIGRRPRLNSTDGELGLPRRGLCDEAAVLRSHRWDPAWPGGGGGGPPPPPRGMVNLGNTCFLNATLQCLAYAPALCQSLAALPPAAADPARRGTDGAKRGNDVALRLRALFRKAHGRDGAAARGGGGAGPLAPRRLRGSLARRFRPGRQEDAHELLIHLLDAMHEGELLAAGINPHASGWSDKLPVRRLHETTLVHRIFGGYFRSQLHCHECGYKSNTYDPFLDLALEVSKKHIHSLAGAVEEFMRREKLDRDNKWSCSGCDRRVCPTKHLSVFRPPLALCVHLKRFEYAGEGGSLGGGGWEFGSRHGTAGNGGSKISKKINFPAVFGLPLSDGRLCQYLLTGVIVHVGKSARSGHYTAYVKRPGDANRWYHMDDCHTETVSEKTVLRQRDAYVLFYTRKEVKLEIPATPATNGRSGGKGRGPASNEAPSGESSQTKPDSRSAAALSPASDAAAPTRENEARSGSSKSKTGGSDTPAPSKDKHQARVKRFLDYVKDNDKGRPRSNKKRKAWSPPRAGKFDASQPTTLLLGGINVASWNGDDDGPPRDSLRSKASKQMEEEARRRKKKMRTEFWDSHIDEAKIKKTKRKSL